MSTPISTTAPGHVCVIHPERLGPHYTPIGDLCLACYNDWRSDWAEHRQIRSTTRLAPLEPRPETERIHPSLAPLWRLVIWTILLSASALFMVWLGRALLRGLGVLS